MSRLPRYRIVVALDGSEYAEIVLEHAMDQAARHESPELHFLTVVTRSQRSLEDARRGLAELVVPAFEDLDCAEWSVCLHIRSGVAHEEIAIFASDIRASLIVIGRFGLHHRTGRLGSVASRVLDRASCPTLVIGLLDQSPDLQPECCVEVRALTDGERWFCDAHAVRERASLAVVVPRGPGSAAG